MDNTDQLIKQLKRHEGIELTPYKDTEGILTIGIGRNLEHRGITEKEAEFMLMNDLAEFMKTARSYVWYDSLNDVRKAVIVNMLFNLGQPRFNKFVAMQEALKAQNYATAAAEMLDSRWAKQVKGRATELAEQMRTGKWQPY